MGLHVLYCELSAGLSRSEWAAAEHEVRRHEGVEAGDCQLSVQSLEPHHGGVHWRRARPQSRRGQEGVCIYPPSDELQDLLARLTSRAYELGTRGIYRGEPECFPRISSGLNRQLYEIDDWGFNIGRAQQRRIELARQYAPHLSDDDILTRLQHLGGKTNLIDFTRDLNIALFFGSYHSPDRDGRVILMDEARVLRNDRPRNDRPAGFSDRLVPRGNPASMTDVQKSVWVEPWRGHIAEGDVTIVEIPSALKSEILSHLRVVYGIEASSVYNDLSGLIRDQDRFRDHEAEWYAGLRAYQAGHDERALGFFAQHEQLAEEPESSLEYFRGFLYWRLDRKEEALAAMARFRSQSPSDARAFREEMESAYFEHRRSPEADRRRIERDGGAPATKVFPGFCIRPVVRDAGRPVGVLGVIKITHETGASQRVALEKDTFVAFPELTPDAGGTWQLSLQEGYYDDSQPMHWPIRETLVLKAFHGDARDVTMEIESLQYTYEPDIIGPFVSYPARAEDGGGSTA